MGTSKSSFVRIFTKPMGYVMDAVKPTKETLNDEVPLIGFLGSPWTIFCYAVEGKGSKSYDTAKGFVFQPEAAHALLQKLMIQTILYLKESEKVVTLFRF